MNNIHNFNKFSPSTYKTDHSRLWFIVAIAVILIGGELVWSEIRKASFDIDTYSAAISSAVPNRDAREAHNLAAEADLIETGEEVEGEFRKIDTEINSL